MKVLMFGWEFPPHFSGGLGIVCYELTKAYSSMGVETTYVMPFGPPDLKADFVDLVMMNNLLQDPNVQIEKLPAMLTPYVTPGEYDVWYDKAASKLEGGAGKSLYSSNLFEEVRRFGKMASIIARTKEFDVIHSHDWLTYLAGIRAKEISGKPLVVHVHATEFDRTGDGAVNQFVYDIERAGMHAADIVIPVSNKIRDRCIYQYGISPDKIRVVHNAVTFSDGVPMPTEIKSHDKIVLFLGRITLQKGPDYFIEAAKKILDVDPNVKFIMAGSGDMLAKTMHRAAELGIAGKVIFPGFVSREEGDKLYRMADVLVMPSVSEPFGIVPLEAMMQDTPVIISKQSGVAEILKHCIKVDFWDVDDMAQKILGVLHYQQLHNTLKDHGKVEVRELSWDKPAAKCLQIYEEAMRK